MTIQLLSLLSHPTVIAANDGTGAFEGWGIRIGN